MIKTAVIGTGNMGKNHARVYSELNGASLVAIAESSKAGEELAKRFNCSYYVDYNDMLDSEEIDAISICVPTSLHKTVALDCIKNEKNILIEKPIATTVKEADEILVAAEKKKIILTVGHIERFNPAVKRLKEGMEKELGTPTSIIARRVGVFPPQIKHANVILDLAVHDIDIFNYLIGTSPEEVFAKAGDALNSGREDHAIIFLRYGEAICVVQVNWLTPVKVRELSVTGATGYAELNYITQDLRIFKSNYERKYDSFGEFMLKFGTPNEIMASVSKVEPLKVELTHFLDCIKNNKEPRVTGADGRLALLIAAKAIESFHEGTPVKLE
jgi:UDP-N-acetylglucosamine 3-dehydrogenase